MQKCSLALKQPASDVLTRTPGPGPRPKVPVVAVHSESVASHGVTVVLSN